MAKGPLLQVDDLRVEFSRGKTQMAAVDSVSFEVDSGECLGIVGESASGKSITCLAILNLLPFPGRIKQGRILFEGVDVLKLNDHELRRLRGGQIAIVFQDPTSALNPLFTIGHQLVDVIQAHTDADSRAARTKAIAALRLAGFPDPEQRLDSYPSQLSGGLRQRVAIAMALSCAPKLLISDEATTNLDVSVQAQILKSFRQLKQELGLAMIFISHDVGLVASIADRMLVMYAGQAVELGRTREILDHPAHPYTIGLLHSIPTLESQKDHRLQSIPGSIPELGRRLPGAPFANRCPVLVEGICEYQRPGWTQCAPDHWVACHRFARDGWEGTAWVR